MYATSAWNELESIAFAELGPDGEEATPSFGAGTSPDPIQLDVLESTLRSSPSVSSTTSSPIAPVF